MIVELLVYLSLRLSRPNKSSRKPRFYLGKPVMLIFLAHMTYQWCLNEKKNTSKFETGEHRQPNKNKKIPGMNVTISLSLSASYINL